MTPIASKDVTAQEVATEALRLGDEVIRLRATVEDHITNQSDDWKALNDKIDKLRDDMAKRVPVWVTAVMSILGTMFGAASGVAYTYASQVNSLQQVVHNLSNGIK